MVHTILWRRLDLPGHEVCRVQPLKGEWLLAGTAVFTYEGEPCKVDYRILCDASWRTTSANIVGQVGKREIELSVSANEERRWALNGIDCPAVTGCLDIDLGFSPSTNLLPIRRLSLAVGESAEVQAAWLAFPAFSFELLSQTYNRTGETIYQYESDGGAFARRLEVNECGFVTRYPGLWQIESTT